MTENFPRRNRTALDRPLPSLRVVLAVLFLLAARASAAEPVSRWIFEPARVVGQSVRAAAGGLHAVVTGPLRFAKDPPALELAGDARQKHGVEIRGELAAIRRALPSAALSAEVWVRIERVGAWGGLVGYVQDHGGVEKGWFVGTRGSSFVFGLSTSGADDGDGRMTCLESETSFEPDAWYHVVSTYDGSEQRIYVDGTLQGVSQEQSGAILYPAESFYTIGVYRDQDSFYPMDAAIAEVAVYDRALGVEEVRSRFEARKSSFPGIEPLRDPVEGWPTYLRDDKRSGVTNEVLELPLRLEWIHRSRHPPAPAWPPPARQNLWAEKFDLKARVVFDRSFGLVADRSGVYFGSSLEGKIASLDPRRGRERWAFYTGGPVRLAPTIAGGRLYAGSDDGFVYCLGARDGAFLWRYRAGPDDRRIPGNGRIISVWPVRTGTLVLDGRLFGCAGIFPCQGAFRFVLDAVTGSLIQRQAVDRSPQGYLARHGSRLFVDQGRSPAAFLSRLGRQGKTHSPALREIPGEFPHALVGAAGLRFAAGDGRVAAFDSRSGRRLWTAPVEGVAYSLAVANGALLASTDRGLIYSFRSASEDPDEAVGVRPSPVESYPYAAEAVRSRCERVVAAALEHGGEAWGYGFVFGRDVAGLAHELARSSPLRWIGADGDSAVIQKARRSLDAAGLLGERVSMHTVDLSRLPYADFIANRVVIELDRSDTALRSRVAIEDALRMLRPGGGLAVVGSAEIGGPTGSRMLERFLKDSGASDLGWEIVDGDRGSWAYFRRPPLEGVGEWTHMYADPGNTACSGDTRVAGDLQLQWFGKPGPRGMVDRHLRPASPLWKDGRLFVPGNDRVYCVDAYNGAAIWELEVPGSTRAGAFRDCGPMAVADDLLYVAAGASCRGFSVASGERRVSFEIGSISPRDAGEDRDWGYLAVAGDLLYGSAVSRGASRREQSKETIDGTYYDARPMVGSEFVFAVDRHRGETRWVYRPEAGLVPNPTLAVGGGRIYFVESTNPQSRLAKAGRATLEVFLKSARLVALDGHGGAVLWRHAVALAALRHSVYVCYARGKVVVSGSRNGQGRVHVDLRVFDAESGELEWTRSQDNLTKAGGAHGEQDLHPVVVGDRLYCEPYAYDLASGEGLEPWSWRKSARRGCGTIAASARSLFFRDQTAAMFDLDGETYRSVTAVSRPGCWINMIPAGGLLLIPEASSGCTCDFAVQASMAFGPCRRP